MQKFRFLKRGHIILEQFEQILRSNGLLQLVFLVITTVFACAKVTIQSRACRKYILNSQDSVLYNVMFFASVAAALAIALPLAAPTRIIIIFAAISSITTSAFQILYSVALTAGPVSLTVLIVNFSVLFPTAMSVLFLGDNLYLSQMLGIVCLIISMLLSFNKGENEQKANTKWLILTIVCLLTNGLGSCIQKVFYETDTSNIANSDNTYLVFIYIFSSVLSLTFYFIKANTGKKEKSTYWFSKNVLFYAMLVGVIIAIFQKLYMMSNKNIDGVVMFPTYYGLQSLGMTLIGIALFKDNLNAKQKLGIVFGTLSIVLMTLKLGFCVKI